MDIQMIEIDSDSDIDLMAICAVNTPTGVVLTFQMATGVSSVFIPGTRFSDNEFELIPIAKPTASDQPTDVTASIEPFPF